VGEVGKWLPWDDDASNAEEAVYAEPKLNEMMKSYQESQQKAAEYNEERKMKAHAEASKKKKEMLKKAKEAKETNQADLTNDIITKDLIESNINALSSSEIVVDTEKLEQLNEKVKLEQIELIQDKNIIETKENTIHKIDEELEKAKQLYEDLIKKYNIEKNQT
jgi:hypothetical protein